MSRLPSVKPRIIVRILKKLGFVIDHQTGSHIIMEKPGHPLIVTVPMHNKDLKKGTLKAILNQAAISTDEFIRLM